MTDSHLPIPDPETEEFWAALAQDRLLLQYCNSCERPHYYPRSFCPWCWSDNTDWREASGLGTVFATTVIRQMGLEPFGDRVPYNVSIVELDEGPRMLTNVIGVDAAEVRIGMRVELAAEHHGDIGLPLFRLHS
ncbi:MAG: Zn-ribbon domain-containing OB-fold protein [Acidimicrobiales bacterium]